MNKSSVEFKRWCQISLPSEESSAGVQSDHTLTGTLFCTRTLVRCSQFFMAALFAGGFYLLTLWSGDGMPLLAAWAATSAFVYIGLAIQSRTRTMLLLNLFAVPIIFATACAGMNVAAEWLIVSFLLHGSITAVQLSSVDENLRGGLLFWSAFNNAMALFLLLGEM